MFHWEKNLRLAGSLWVSHVMVTHGGHHIRSPSCSAPFLHISSVERRRRRRRRRQPPGVPAPASRLRVVRRGCGWTACTCSGDRVVFGELLTFRRRPMHIGRVVERASRRVRHRQAAAVGVSSGSTSMASTSSAAGTPTPARQDSGSVYTSRFWMDVRW